MTKVIMDVTVGLDGRPQVDAAALADAMQRGGALVMSRSVFHMVDVPDGWSDPLCLSASNVHRSPPFFVVTQNPPGQTRLNLDVTFVTEGVATAVDAARAQCPPDRDVVIMGGGSLIAQAVDQGLVDEMVLRVSPILMYAGTDAAAGVVRFPSELRRWRTARGLSQLDLAIRAGTTQRHLSFIEQGRSRPGRDVVVRLAESMNLTLRETNALLAAAGFAPAFQEAPLDAAALRPLRLALDSILDGSPAAGRPPGPPS